MPALNVGIVGRDLHHFVGHYLGRLAKADTLRHYDDNREDLGGTAARLIAP
jgi:hypothetical protein